MQEQTLNKDHYVCDGECGGVSPEPGVCQAGEKLAETGEVCSQYNQPLSPCNCDLPEHNVVGASLDAGAGKKMHGGGCC